jgi:glutathione S-transferase
MDLFDSPVICEYLDSHHKGRKLLPRKGRERWVALRLQAMADGLLDAAILTRYEGALRPKDKRWPDWKTPHTAATARRAATRNEAAQWSGRRGRPARSLMRCSPHIEACSARSNMLQTRTSR